MWPVPVGRHRMCYFYLIRTISPHFKSKNSNTEHVWRCPIFRAFPANFLVVLIMTGLVFSPFEWLEGRKWYLGCGDGQNWSMKETLKCLVWRLQKLGCQCFLDPPALQLRHPLFCASLVCAGFSASVSLMVSTSWRTQTKKEICACQPDVDVGSYSSSASHHSLRQGIHTTHIIAENMKYPWNT